MFVVVASLELRDAIAVKAAQLSQPYFALSIEVREINTPLSWKTNAMHSRIRNAANASSTDKGHK